MTPVVLIGVAVVLALVSVTAALIFHAAWNSEPREPKPEDTMAAQMAELKKAMAECGEAIGESLKVTMDGLANWLHDVAKALRQPADE